ncbi:MAG: hypothetical protein WD995_03975 [Gemmatimonadota bacterium]
MHTFLSGAMRWLEALQGRRLSMASRGWILVAVAAMGASFLFPLWHIHLEAPQYPEGLDLWIYGHELAAGNEGQDLEEINILNHYIGMRPLREIDFLEMTMIPFVLGSFMLLGLRAAVFGIMRNLIDVLMLFVYASLFAFVNFAYRMYVYGHDLDPRAPINPDPFMPALVGTNQIANMTQTSLPSWGSGFLLVALAAMALAIYLSRKESLVAEAAYAGAG